MSKRELREKIEALEKRVAELEARPMPSPWDTPKWAPPHRSGITEPSNPMMTWPKITCGVAARQPQNADVQAAYDHDGLRSSGSV